MKIACQHLSIRQIGLFTLPDMAPGGQLLVVRTGLQVAYENRFRHRLILQTLAQDVFVSEREQVTNTDFVLRADDVPTGGNVSTFYIYTQSRLFAVGDGPGTLLRVMEEVYGY